MTTVSIYQGAGDADAAKAFTRDFIRQHPVPVAVGLDVGWIHAHGWAVIEANPVWGMRLDGCDPDAFADCLRLATRPT